MPTNRKTVTTFAATNICVSGQRPLYFLLDVQRANRVDRQRLFCNFCARTQKISKQHCHFGPFGWTSSSSAILYLTNSIFPMRSLCLTVRILLDPFPIRLLVSWLSLFTSRPLKLTLKIRRKTSNKLDLRDTRLWLWLWLWPMTVTLTVDYLDLERLVVVGIPQMTIW